MRSSRRRVALGIVVAAFAMPFLSAPAIGERAQSGNVIVSLNGEVTPHFLPRSRSAPVTISMSSDFYTADGSRLPQLRQISLALGQRGTLRPPAGLPVCRSARIRFTTREQAMAECGSSLVGRGHLDAEIAMPGQKPFSFKGALLAFNGRLPDGRFAIVADIESKAPPVSFVMPFVLTSGPDGVEMKAKLPRAAGGWAHVTHFDMTLGRRYEHEGRARSMLTARCAVPRGFTAIVFPLAQATYSFAGGRSVTVAATRSCSVRR